MNTSLDSSFGRFMDRVRARMEVGSETYGDISLTRPRAELVDEIMQELEDVAGWSVLLWHRVERLRDPIAAIDPEAQR